MASSWSTIVRTISCHRTRGDNAANEGSSKIVHKGRTHNHRELMARQLLASTNLLSSSSRVAFFTKSARTTRHYGVASLCSTLRRMSGQNSFNSLDKPS